MILLWKMLMLSPADLKKCIYKDLINDKLYQIIYQFAESKIRKVKFCSILLKQNASVLWWKWKNI